MRVVSSSCLHSQSLGSNGGDQVVEERITFLEVRHNFSRKILQVDLLLWLFKHRLANDAVCLKRKGSLLEETTGLVLAGHNCLSHSMSSCKGVMILVPPGTRSLHTYKCK
jgi:hypothetical protein